VALRPVTGSAPRPARNSSVRSLAAGISTCAGRPVSSSAAYPNSCPAWALAITIVPSPASAYIGSGEDWNSRRNFSSAWPAEASASTSAVRMSSADRPRAASSAGPAAGILVSRSPAATASVARRSAVNGTRSQRRTVHRLPAAITATSRPIVTSAPSRYCCAPPICAVTRACRAVICACRADIALRTASVYGRVTGISACRAWARTISPLAIAASCGPATLASQTRCADSAVRRITGSRV